MVCISIQAYPLKRVFFSADDDHNTLADQSSALHVTAKPSVFEACQSDCVMRLCSRHSIAPGIIGICPHALPRFHSSLSRVDEPARPLACEMSSSVSQPPSLSPCQRHNHAAAWCWLRQLSSSQRRRKYDLVFPRMEERGGLELQGRGWLCPREEFTRECAYYVCILLYPPKRKLNYFLCFLPWSVCMVIGGEWGKCEK